MRSAALPMEDRYRETEQAFDSVADYYDGPSGNNRMIQHMREVVWKAVEELAVPPAWLLDLGCGTGLDAAHFAQAGYVVTAIDASAGMVEQSRNRLELAGSHIIQLGMQNLGQLESQKFDVVYSNLGALNCLPDLYGVAQACARLQKPGGWLVFSVIGRLCPWELAYYLMRGNVRRACIRFAPYSVPVGLNQHTVWTRYYWPAELYRAFAPFYIRGTCRSINLFAPPPYLVTFANKHPDLVRALLRLDQRVGRVPPLNRAGDHFLIVMRRRG